MILFINLIFQIFRIFLAPPPVTVPPININPCIPSPCGPNSQCRDIGGTYSCSCLANYIGMPPNCRPECVINSECSSNLACLREKCRDPCPGSCGAGAQCSVINHIPICICPEGYTGDPFSNCFPKPPPRKEIFYFHLNINLINNENLYNKIIFSTRTYIKGSM